MVHTPSLQPKRQSAETSMRLGFDVDFGKYLKVKGADMRVINGDGRGRQ